MMTPLYVTTDYLVAFVGELTVRVRVLEQEKAELERQNADLEQKVAELTPPQKEGQRT